MQSAWGSDTLVERPSIFHPLGDGWHVDRGRFDERLAAWASSVGASVRANVGRCRVERMDSGFQVSPARAEAVVARFLFDASGRGAPGSAPLRQRAWLAWDRQVALVARVAASSRDVGNHLLLEAAEEGWWYSVPQADGALVVVLITDADLVPAGGQGTLEARFRAALSRTGYTAERAHDLAFTAGLRVVRSDSGWLLPDRGLGWRAIGDAAMATDPLAGDGVARAITSALDAVGSLETQADGGEIATAFSRYLDARARYHASEARWPDAPFWARRRPIVDWKEAPVMLSPEATVVWGHAPPPHAEALLPPRALRELRAVLASPRPAHLALSRLRDIVPVGDRRLLVGLQALVVMGSLKMS